MSQIEHLSIDLNRKDYVPKHYILAENSTRSSHKSAMAPQSYSENAPAPGPSAIVVPAHKHNETKKKESVWILGFLAGSFAGALSAMVFSLLFKMVMIFIKGSRDDSGVTIFSPLIWRT